MDNVMRDINSIIETNLIKKKKGSKHLIDLENTKTDLNKLKTKYVSSIQKCIQGEIGMKEIIWKTWSYPLALTLSNSIVEFFFSKVKNNYTPCQPTKNGTFYTNKKII